MHRPTVVAVFQDAYFGGDAPIVTRTIDCDADGRAVSVQDDVASDGKLDRVRTWSYGSDGLLEHETTVDHGDATCNPRGTKRVATSTTTYRVGYDRYSMHTSKVGTVEPDGGQPTTQYRRVIQYDDAGFPELLQSRGRTTALVWDDHGRLRHASASDGTRASFRYAAQGRVRWAAQRGETTRYDYDPHGRSVGSQARRDSDDTNVGIHQIDYDQQGRLVREQRREIETGSTQKRWVEYAVDGRMVAEVRGKLLPRMADRLRAVEHAELLDRPVRYRLQRFDRRERPVMEIQGGQSQARE